MAEASTTPTEAHEGVEMTRVLQDDSNNALARCSNHSTGSHPLADSAKHALHRFFYPPSHDAEEEPHHDEDATPRSIPREEAQDPPDTILKDPNDDRAFVNHFWTTYDDILILSIFTQVGIVFRLAAASWFARFDDVFSHDAPLFVNLPLNCLSCFIMGLLGSGERLMEVIGTRFSPATTQQTIVNHHHEEEDPEQSIEGHKHLRRRRRRPKGAKEEHFHSWQPPVQLYQDLRDVQLMALERRIRLSKCLVLFPLKKEDVDVMEHYCDRGYGKQDPLEHLDDLALQEEGDEIDGTDDDAQHTMIRKSESRSPTIIRSPLSSPTSNLPTTSSESSMDSGTSKDDPENSYLADFTNNVQENVTTQIHRLNRLQSNSLFLEGWDTGTTVNDMSDDLLLGLRDGFCGALSSFSSWNSSMVALLRQAEITKAVVGYLLGIQLPIISYRFGQHVAVYLFVWRTRSETRIAERRGGYGIRLAQEESGDVPRRIPSLRAVFTALFILAITGQCIMIWMLKDHQQLALSLLFSPLGVLARWRLSKWNTWKPTFPIGTFTANLLACALSGSLGSLLAGNPGPEERIMLVSFVAGFGGTLSSLATFIVEVLAGIDPILFRFDGALYAVASVGCAMVIGFVLSASVEWADETVLGSA